MPSAKIAPSVLSSDFSQLAAECKRMVEDGADWLHMGEYETIYITTSEGYGLIRTCSLQM